MLASKISIYFTNTPIRHRSANRTSSITRKPSDKADLLDKSYLLVGIKPLSEPMLEYLLIRPLGTNFSEFLIEILIFVFTKMCLKVQSGKCRPSCLGIKLNVVLDRRFGRKFEF